MKQYKFLVDVSAISATEMQRAITTLPDKRLKVERLVAFAKKYGCLPQSQIILKRTGPESFNLVNGSVYLVAAEESKLEMVDALVFTDDEILDDLMDSI